jgi:hypothetical protein
MTNVECRMTKEERRMTEAVEFGIGTRRRPIGQDYAAAKDAECGLKKNRRSEVEKMGRWGLWPLEAMEFGRLKDDMAAKRHKKHKNRILHSIISIGYEIEIRDF